MRVLVCGGRDYADYERLCAVLDKLHAEAGIDVVIHGAYRGADTLADAWATSRGVRPEPYEVTSEEWAEFGSFAGPRRNKRMLTEGHPNVVVAFPTPGARNKGTKGMMALARKAGVQVVEIAP